MTTATHQAKRKPGPKTSQSERLARLLDEVIIGKRVFSLHVATKIRDHLREMAEQAKA